MRRPRSNTRGQATVELAVTMVVLVPIVMYTLFLNDLLSYNLDWQEAIVTPAWDALVADFPKADKVTDPVNRVQSVNRKTFCDHTSAYDSYHPDFDCSDEWHHTAMTAHQCWLAGGKQVTCTVNARQGNVEQKYLDTYNRGGLISCTARLGVVNYFLPQKFLSSHNDVTRTTKFSGSVHGSAGSATTGNAWVFGAQGGGGGASGETADADGTATEDSGGGLSGATDSDDFFGVLHDSWALNHLKSVMPEKGAETTGHPLYLRDNLYYQPSGPLTKSSQGNVEQQAVTAAADFGALVAGAADLDDAIVYAQDNAYGDDPREPNIAFVSQDHSKVGGSGPVPAGVVSNHGAPWVHHEQQQTSRTFSACSVRSAGQFSNPSGDGPSGPPAPPNGGPGNQLPPGTWNDQIPDGMFPPSGSTPGMNDASKATYPPPPPPPSTPPGDRDPPP